MDDGDGEERGVEYMDGVEVESIEEEESLEDEEGRLEVARSCINVPTASSKAC